VLQPDPTGGSSVTTTCRSLAKALSGSRFASGIRPKTYTTTRGTIRRDNVIRPIAAYELVEASEVWAAYAS
jgi:hypothetical protein